MQFFGEKLKIHRKKSRLSCSELGTLAGASRNTVSSWESGKTTPNEKKIRLLADILNVDTSKISNIIGKEKIFEGEGINPLKSWIDASLTNTSDINANLETFILLLKGVNSEIYNANVVSRAIMSSIHTMFYIKDTSQVYISANSSFLNFHNMSEDFIVKGKRDSHFFSVSDAKLNEKEDREIIQNGKGFINKKCFFRKKSFLVSKVPIKDINGNIIGLSAEFADITLKNDEEKGLSVLHKLICSINMYCWAGKGISYDEKGFPYTRSLFLRIGKGLSGFYGNYENDEISTFQSMDETIAFRKLVPESAKRYFAERLEKGTYPIVRNYKIISPFTNKEFNVKEFIYYFKDADILCGFMFDMPEDSR